MKKNIFLSLSCILLFLTIFGQLHSMNGYPDIRINSEHLVESTRMIKQLVEKIVTICKKSDFPKMSTMKSSHFFDQKIPVEIELKITTDQQSADHASHFIKQAGFILAGLGVGAVSCYTLALLAQKNITLQEREGSAQDSWGALGLSAVGLVGALALIGSSGYLAQFF